MNTRIAYTLYVRRYAPFRSFGGGFEGDARDFSTKLDVTSRTVGTATFNPRVAVPIATTGTTSGSAYVGPWEVRNSIGKDSIGHRLGQVRASVTNAVGLNDAISFTLYTEGNLPLKDLLFHKTIAGALDRANRFVRPNSRHPQGTPDIDTFVDFRASRRDGKILFEGVVRGDGFPNAEVFVMDARSQVVALLDFRTKSGTWGPARLLGAHAGNVLAVFRREVELNADGSFGRNHNRPPHIVREA